jgi:MYXO-CTERM domain-containing protein
MLAGLGLDYSSEDTMIDISPPSDSGSSFDWGGILKTGIDAAGKLGVPLITGLLAPSTTPAGQPAPTIMQVAVPTAPRTVVAAAPSSKLPWIIGGAAALGLLAFLVLRKRK